MKKILYILLMVTSSAHAEKVFEAPLTFQCTDNYLALQERIASSKYKETLKWGGYSEDSKSMFLVYTNEETNTWTLIQTNGELACIMGVGEQSKFIESKKDSL